MNDMNDEMHHDSMDMGGMSMQMTFGHVLDYKVTIVWDWWKVTTVTQYVFSWIFVVFLVVFLFIVKMRLITTVEEKMRLLQMNSKEHDSDHTKNNNSKNTANNDAESVVGEGTTTTRYSLLGGDKDNASSSLKSVWMLRLLHAFLSALGYALALLLMLISMTYNVGLCVALLCGYFLGESWMFVGYMNLVVDDSHSTTSLYNLF